MIKSAFTFTAEFGKSKTSIFLRDPEGYGTKKSIGKERSDWLAVRTHDPRILRPLLVLLVLLVLLQLNNYGTASAREGLTKQRSHVLHHHKAALLNFPREELI